MTYQIFKPTGAQGGDNPILVADDAIDTSLYDSSNRVGIQLVGRNAVNYGTAVAQNAVQLASNFAGSVQPSDAIALQGQLWYNTATGAMFVRTGATGIVALFATNWRQVSPVPAAAPGSVTNATLAPVASPSIKGRVTAGLGDVEDLTGTQATSLLDTFTSGLKGLAPASGGGSTNFLRADGTWAAPSGGGTVTSVGVSSANAAITVGATPVTGAGTISLTANNFTTSTPGVVPASGGGTVNFLRADGTWTTPAGGGGTVTSVSVNTANGVSGSVATAATTPVITLILGAITPTTVVVASAANATSTATGSLRTAGGAGISGDLWATNIFATGDVTAAASDSRLKKDLTIIGGALAKVQALTGYTFNWDQSICREAGFEFSAVRQVGLIAQDVQSVLPEAVSPAPANDEYLTVRYERIVALLVEAVKDLAREIEVLKGR